MHILYKNRKLLKIFDSEKCLRREYGDRCARAIMARLDVLRSATCLAEVPYSKPERCHQLKQDRDEQFAVDLYRSYRLVFEVAHDPIPRTANGGIDKELVTAIRIMEVIDYHS